MKKLTAKKEYSNSILISLKDDSFPGKIFWKLIVFRKI
jgi:hypothetical protein